MSALTPLAPIEREFLVVCLCAAWCGTCREYQAGFEQLKEQYPNVGFVWVEVEDEQSGVEDWDVENFPTLLIQRKELVLFFGPMLPYHRLLAQMLETYTRFTYQESLAYVHATPERAGWQGVFDYRSVKRRIEG
ncbi:MAG: thioredoxin family protein [Rhodocyclaceae bacterium]|nr:thioredoxin family protein [Rhodocyclaceae bacterium]